MVELLSGEGYPVTQATVSRDLEAIGAVKDRSEDCYRLGDESAPDAAHSYLGRIMADFVQEIAASGNLVVLKTPPGAAQMVASAVDWATLDQVIGTVAGDDTVFVASAASSGGSELAEILERIGAGQ